MRDTICGVFTRYISSTTTRTMAATRQPWLNRSVCLTNLREKSKYLGRPGCHLRLSHHHWRQPREPCSETFHSENIFEKYFIPSPPSQSWPTSPPVWAPENPSLSTSSCQTSHRGNISSGCTETDLVWSGDLKVYLSMCRYNGSLSKPPCKENVVHTVFKDIERSECLQLQSLVMSFCFV